MKKVVLADWRTSNGLPSASDPETEADRTPRGSLLACMTANREPRLIKALKRQGGDGLAASRRFFPFCGRFQKPAKTQWPLDDLFVDLESGTDARPFRSLRTMQQTI